jgi:DNA replication protein DnaC
MQLSSKQSPSTLDHQAVLEAYLRALKLPMFLHHYLTYAQDAARSGLSFERYLLALCEAEMAERDARRIERAIASAKLPFVKEISTFDFDVAEKIPKARILELAEGEYLAKAENLLLLGNPGLGKTRPTHYPYRANHACAGRNGDGGRSAPPALWANPAVCRHR